MLWAPADVREGQHRQQVGDRPLTVGDAKALLDHPREIDPPPANHAVYRWIGAGFDDLGKFAHLLVRQEPWSARARTVLQALWARLIEAMRPIPQRLPVHPADLRGLRADHAVVNRRQGQEPSNLARVTAGLGQASKLKSVVIVA